MENHNPKRFAKTAFWTFVLIGFINISVGIVGYFRLGVPLKTEENFLTAFLNTKYFTLSSNIVKVWINIACVCFTISLTINHSFESRSFAAAIEKILNVKADKNGKKWTDDWKCKQCIFIAFTYVVMSLALLLGKLNDAISLNSGIIATSLIFTLPGIMLVGLMNRDLKYQRLLQMRSKSNALEICVRESIASNSPSEASSYTTKDNESVSSKVSVNNQQNKLPPTVGLIVGYSLILFGVSVTICCVYSFVSSKTSGTASQ